MSLFEGLLIDHSVGLPEIEVITKDDIRGIMMGNCQHLVSRAQAGELGCEMILDSEKSHSHIAVAYIYPKNSPRAPLYRFLMAWRYVLLARRWGAIWLWRFLYWSEIAVPVQGEWPNLSHVRGFEFLRGVNDGK